MSHPARGAWIEIGVQVNVPPPRVGRTPQGVRGLKYAAALGDLRLHGRTPQGVRGLKFRRRGRSEKIDQVAPRKGCVD